MFNGFIDSFEMKLGKRQFDRDKLYKGINQLIRDMGSKKFLHMDKKRSTVSCKRYKTTAFYMEGFTELTIKDCLNEGNHGSSLIVRCRPAILLHPDDEYALSGEFDYQPFENSFKEYDSLILADGPKGTYSMDPHISQVNNNVLVIAGTGGGKTKSVVEANLLHTFHQSMAVLLTKRRLLDQYAPLLKSRGYDVKVLDLVHPERSDVGYDRILKVARTIADLE